MIQARPSTSFDSLHCAESPVTVRISRFEGEGGAVEYHLVLSPIRYESTDVQFGWLQHAYALALERLELEPQTSVFRRFFCSDVSNQPTLLQRNLLTADGPCAISLVGQPPAPPAKLTLWAYHVNDMRQPSVKSNSDSTFCLRRGDLTHIWTTGATCTSCDGSYRQTHAILQEYDSYLRSRSLSLADNVVRTWFFVRDIDANYQGLVDARREVFAQHGLTADTHYIASTGIQGASSDSRAIVTMDAYAISGLRPDQADFLSAPDHLSPTSVYGVTFERGASISYRDRKHILISGTASIDSRGQIVHPGNVVRQFDRTLENVEALLREAGAGLSDACVFIVYLRDPSDIEAAESLLAERLGEAPFQIVLAPVCRPGWLVEIECQAVVPASRPELPTF